MRAFPKSDQAKKPHFMAFMGFKTGNSHVLREVKRQGSKINDKVRAGVRDKNLIFLEIVSGPRKFPDKQAQICSGPQIFFNFSSNKQSSLLLFRLFG